LKRRLGGGGFTKKFVEKIRKKKKAWAQKGFSQGDQIKKKRNRFRNLSSGRNLGKKGKIIIEKSPSKGGRRGGKKILV